MSDQTPIEETDFLDEDLYRLFQSLPGHNGGPYDRHYTGWEALNTYHSGKGWEENETYSNWQEFSKSWDIQTLDPDLNLVADFYFDLNFNNEKCGDCGGKGFNPETCQIEDDFYGFGVPGSGWVDNITQDELDALKEHNRIPPEATLEEVNEANKRNALYPLNHDAMNRWILVETRAKRLGVYGECDNCKGNGWQRTGNDRIELHVWMLHPRKMASKGILIRSVESGDLDAVKSFLNKSRELHKEHFAWTTDS